MVQRRVHFSDSENDSVQVSIREIIPLSDMTDDEKDAVWYSHPEYHHTKCLAKSIARGIQDRESLSTSSCGYSHVLLAAYKSILSNDDMSEDEVRIFERWIVSGHSRRGLEQWAIPDLQSMIQARKFGSIRKVVDMQRSFSESDHPDYDLAEAIAAMYAKNSEATVRFSLLMGQADQSAVSRGGVDALLTLENTKEASNEARSSKGSTQKMQYMKKLQVLRSRAA